MRERHVSRAAITGVEEAEEEPRGPGGRKEGIGVRAWLLINTSGEIQVVEAVRHAIMRRTGLPARDLCILDPQLSYPSTILGREQAIVLNLEHIKAIFTAHEFLLLNSRDSAVAPFVEELQSRLARQTCTLQEGAYLALDELTSKISTLNLERVRQIKSRQVAISGRVQKERKGEQ